MAHLLDHGRHAARRRDLPLGRLREQRPLHLFVVQAREPRPDLARLERALLHAVGVLEFEQHFFVALAQGERRRGGRRRGRIPPKPDGHVGQLQPRAWRDFLALGVAVADAEPPPGREARREVKGVESPERAACRGGLALLFGGQG